MNDSIQWPRKNRELHNHHMDSTIWNEFKFRNDDIIIGSFAKAGTTWTQQIVGQLIYSGDPDLMTEQLTPWLDIRVMPKEVKFEILEAQSNRRFIKTHLPLDALVFNPACKYLYVTRNLPDIAWSLHNHLLNANDEFYDMINNTPGLVGPRLERPSADVKEFWYRLLREDGYPNWSFWENIRSWWEFRDLPNLKLFHFNDLKKNLAGKIRDIANFLEIMVDESRWDDIVEHCTFDWMKGHAEQVTPMGGQIFDDGAKVFINKGTNQRWKDVLTDADIQEYQELAIKELGEECAQWVFNGKTA